VWPHSEADRPHSDDHPFYSFKHKNGGWTEGKPFDLRVARHSLLSAPESYVTLSRDNVNQFAFMVGASSNHFDESIDAVALAQMHFPHHKIIYYDLGLTDEQRATVTSKSVSGNEINFSISDRNLVQRKNTHAEFLLVPRTRTTA
jgi:hypothetical protein